MRIFIQSFFSTIPNFYFSPSYFPYLFMLHLYFRRFFRRTDSPLRFLWFLLMVYPALAQQPVLVKDINTQVVGARSLDPQHLTDRNGTLYFVGNSDSQGRELWKSNGTTAGTTLVKDITPGPASSDITGLTLLNGTLYFATSGELWKSDGTAAGTVRVLRLYPGAATTPAQLVNVNGTLYFSASGGTNRDLWRSDGTAAGTTVIKSFPSAYHTLTLVSAGGALYFSADGNGAPELWKSDGTAAGTVMINAFRVLFIEELRVVNGTAFFAAYGDEGIELYKSNGTAAGTVRVKDIYPGYQSSEWGTPFPELNSSVPRELTNVNGTLFFAASDANGRAVWKSDGTAAGTVRVSAYNSQELNSGSPSGLANVNGTLYFGAQGDLFKSSGTLAGTVRVKDIGTDGVNPANFTLVNGTIFFTAANATSGNELWKTNGTEAGTTLVSDINPGTGRSAPAFLTNVNGTLFLSASNGVSGSELWKSDGTATGTLLVREVTGALTANSDPEKFLDANGTLYFSAYTAANGHELWKSDGTTAGTTLVRDINPGGASSRPFSFVRHNGLVYFAAQNGTNGLELWRTDGTAAGTVMVRDINAGADNGLDQYGGKLFISFNNALYFSAYTAGTGFELWKSDGTAAGTTPVKETIPGTAGGNPGTFASVNGTLYFSVTGTAAAELWKSNGTTAGTVRVKSLPAGTRAANFVNFNNTLFFTAGNGLWKSSGTDAGTTLVKSLNNKAYALLSASGKLWIMEDQGSGWTLWRSDGTTAGTVSLKYSPSLGGAPGAEWFDLNGTLYFDGSTSGAGFELWKSDGTTAGTVQVRDLNPGTGSSLPADFAQVNGTLYFSAYDYAAGERRLWKSNGTAAGTVPAANYPSEVANLFSVNNTLFFTGNDGNVGNELWKLTLTAPAVAGTFRVNAGGIAFRTGDARSFAADAYFSGGTVSSASTAGIGGTADDYLYQTGRHGSSFAYNFPTGNGSYDVTLHFAETYYGAVVPGGAGSRKFHVNIEGARKLTDYDVFARAGGALRVAQETFRVTVSDGTLNVAFLKGLADNPAVKAIEVLPAGAALTINAGGGAFTTGAGKKFSADVYYAGGTVSSIASGEIANTTDDGLYRDARVGAFSYGLPSGNGTFNVTLHFAETYFGSQASGGVGSRKFNVYVENVKRLSDYDVFAKAGGAMRAVKETVQVTVTDGVLNLYFAKGTADNPVVSAIEVTPATTAAREGSPEVSAEAVAVKLFPNPVQDRLYVALPFPAAQVRSTAVTDNAGRVHLLDAHRADGENGLEIPAAGLREGFYLLRLDGPQGTQVVKFLKQ